MRVATLFREVPSVRNGVTQLEKITIRRGYGRAATRTGEGGIILRNIIGSILIAVFLAGSVEGQWNQIPSSWGEIQNAPGDITDITITTSSPLTGGSACTSGACAFTLGLGTVPISKGGTSITTFTLGDVLYSSATNVLSKLAIGTAGQCLVVTAGIPAWGSCSSGAGTVTSVDASGGTTGFSFSGGPITGAGTLTLTGTLAAASFPALTGDVTTSAGSVATSVVKVNGTTPGGSCTNQFVRSLSSSAVPTCASVANADLAGSIDLTTKVTGTLPVANGGSGIATTTAYSLVMSGTTATGAWAATIGPGTATQVLTSNGAGAYPTWQAAAGGISGLTTGRVPYAASSTTLADSTAFVASVANDSVAHWTLTSLFAGKPGLVIKGAASQTANLTEWQNSSSTVLASVSAAGRMGFAIGTASDSTLALVSGGTRYGGYGLNWYDGGGGANVGGFTTTIASTYYTVLADQSSSNTGNIKMGSGVQATWSAAANPTTSGGDEDTGVKRLAAAFVGATDGNAAAGSFGASAYYLGTATSAIKWTSGSGSPESAVTAPVGSLYSRTDGGAATSLYVKESGSGNTGWVAK